jgi:plasmid stability protein
MTGAKKHAAFDSNASNASIAVMATLTIRNLPDELHARLRVRAAKNGRSMEAEVREMLAHGLQPTPSAEDKRAFENALDAAQRDFAAFQVPDLLASDELIAERRLEAWRDTVETHGQLAETRRRV